MTGLVDHPAAGAVTAGAVTTGAATSGRGTAAEPAIRVDGLVKRYGGRAVVDGVSLEIARGELFALLGPNGAGKTTTVEIIEGYRRPDAGTVSVLGSDPIRGGPSLRARVGLMLQGGGIDPRARPDEILRLYAAFHADPRDPAELLDLVGLRAVASTRYRRLSGGEKQRLGLAVALVGRPELLVLDEPTAGMDPEARVATRALIRSLRETGVTVLMTTHDLNDVERLADRVGIIDRGRLVAVGTPSEITASASPGLMVTFATPPTESAVASLGDALSAKASVEIRPGDGRTIDIRGSGNRAVVADPALVATVAAWAAGRDLLITELRASGGSLEDRYLELTGARADARLEPEHDGAAPADAA